MDNNGIQYFFNTGMMSCFYFPLPQLLPSILPFGTSSWRDGSDGGLGWPDCLSAILPIDELRADRLGNFPDPGECLDRSLFFFAFYGTKLSDLSENALERLDWIKSNQLLLRDNLLTAINTSEISRPELPDDDDEFERIKHLPSFGPARLFVGEVTEIMAFYLPDE